MKTKYKFFLFIEPLASKCQWQIKNKIVTDEFHVMNSKKKFEFRKNECLILSFKNGHQIRNSHQIL